MIGVKFSCDTNRFGCPPQGHQDGEYCQAAGAGQRDQEATEPAQLYVDVAALLNGELPKPPPPVLLRRDDGHHLLYAGKVNVLFGDPESGKTWIGLAAVEEALRAGRRAAIIDLDHNGAQELVSKLLALGAKPAVLADPTLFRLYEPEDADMLDAVVKELRGWRPAVALVDSLGELLPLLRLSSNSPDDYTAANRRVLTPLAKAGACVIAIDHLPKDGDARDHGPTGTMAKTRTVNGVLLRVTVVQVFAPGRGGAASLTVEKDRAGGVREHCPSDGKRQLAGKFVMTPVAGADGALDWHVTTPKLGPTQATDADVAELDALDPPPQSQRDVQRRMRWGSDRAADALRRWRALQSDPGAPAPGTTSQGEERSTPIGKSAPGAVEEHPGAGAVA